MATLVSPSPAIYGQEVCYFGPCYNCGLVHGGWEPCSTSITEEEGMNINFVVNGSNVKVCCNKRKSLRVAVAKALIETKNIQDPNQPWEVRTPYGALLSLNETLEDLKREENEVLYINPPAGVSG